MEINLLGYLNVFMSEKIKSGSGDIHNYPCVRVDRMKMETSAPNVREPIYFFVCEPSHTSFVCSYNGKMSNSVIDQY
jgi:hypothetical protein